MAALDKAIALPPGVINLPTKASNSAQWQEVNLLRWDNGRVCPVGGWEKFTYATPASRIRAIHGWIANDGVQYIAYLCEGHLYIDVGDGVLLDRSPTIPIIMPNALTAAGGYGEDTYSLGTFGTARPVQPVAKAIGPAFTMDNWGEDLLVMCGEDKRLLIWKPSTPSVVAATVLNSPLARTFVVTPERHVVVFEIDSEPNHWGWCDQEDIEDWNFADVASKAGEYSVTPAAPIVGAKKVPGGILYWTTAKTYIVRHAGLPFVYVYEEIAALSAPTSPQASILADNKLYWVNSNGWWEFNGASIEAIFCPIWTWIEDKIDMGAARDQASLMHMVETAEMWFFFPEKGSAVNTHYAMYDYRQNCWAMGKMSRSCGIAATYTTFPLMSDGLNVYKHESGEEYVGVDEGPWGETFTINISGGIGLMTFNQMIPDIDGNSDNVRFSLKYKIPRSDKGVEVSSPKQPIRPNGYVDFRNTGRDFRLRLDSTNINGAFWTFGTTLISIIPRGKK